MPDLLLEPIQNRDAAGQVLSVTDPAEDIAQFLLQHPPAGYQPQPLPDVDKATLDQLTLEYLRGAFHESKAKQYADRGIPAQLGGHLADGGEGTAGAWRQGPRGTDRPAETALHRQQEHRQVRLFRLPRHSRFRDGQADRTAVVRLGTQGPELAGLREDLGLSRSSRRWASRGGRCRGRVARGRRQRRLFPPATGRRQPYRLPVPEAGRAAQLRLSSRGEQGLQRSVADAPISIHGRGPRGDHDVRVGLGRPAADGQVRLRPGRDAGRDRRRTRAAGPVQVRQLPRVGAAEVAPGIQAGFVPAAAREVRLPVGRSPIPTRPTAAVPAAGCPRPAARHRGWHADAGRRRPPVGVRRRRRRAVRGGRVPAADARVPVPTVAAGGPGRPRLPGRPSDGEHPRRPRSSLGSGPAADFWLNTCCRTWPS